MPYTICVTCLERCHVQIQPEHPIMCDHCERVHYEELDGIRRSLAPHEVASTDHNPVRLNELITSRFMRTAFFPRDFVAHMTEYNARLHHVPSDVGRAIYDRDRNHILDAARYAMSEAAGRVLEQEIERRQNLLAEGRFEEADVKYERTTFPLEDGELPKKIIVYKEKPVNKLKRFM